MSYQATKWFTIAVIVGLSIVAVSSPAGAAPAREGALSSGPVTNVDSGMTVDGQTRAAATPAAAMAINGSRIESRWPTGTIAVGASKTWVWNNANPLTVSYEVGFLPVGATTTAACEFTVTRSWYLQRWGGEREFWFTAKNIGGVACAAEVVLASVDPLTSWSTGGINPGASQTTHWNNANPLASAFHVGLSPTGATDTSPCQFEVTRTWYVQQANGEREFYLTVKNVGTIACMADVRLSRISGTLSSDIAFDPGDRRFVSKFGPNPPINVFLVGLSPQGATSAHACQMEVIERSYRQSISGTTTNRVVSFTYKNIGSIRCSAKFLYATVA